MNLYDAYVRAANDYRQKYGFWPPWHDDFNCEPQIVEMHAEWLLKRDSCEERLERLRKLNAPNSIIAKELALLAEANFVLAKTCRLIPPEPPTAADYNRRAWEHAQAALAMGWLPGCADPMFRAGEDRRSGRRKLPGPDLVTGGNMIKVKPESELIAVAAETMKRALAADDIRAMMKYALRMVSGLDWELRRAGTDGTRTLYGRFYGDRLGKLSQRKRKHILRDIWQGCINHPDDASPKLGRIMVGAAMKVLDGWKPEVS